MPLTPADAPAPETGPAAGLLTGDLARDGTGEGSGHGNGDGIAYRTRPYVCGALGRWDAAVLDRLLAAAPGRPREVRSGAGGTLWAHGGPAGTPARERRPDGAQAHVWGALAAGRPGGTGGTWQAAAGERLAAGFEIGPRGALLHTCALGVQDVYVRRLGGALYFAPRIGPLLALDDTPLHVDWATWASILALTAPVGEATPFAEVRRMAAATAWRCDAGSGTLVRDRFEPAWTGAEPDPAVGPREVLDVVARHLPRGGRRAAITLSGGWDSRLLAVLARGRSRGLVPGRRMRAWTTSNDDGRDRDIDYARRVAAALGLDHRVFVPGPEAWLRERTPVRRRLDYQTTHHVWIMPLARRLHRGRDRYLDGLAGDVLLKSLFVDAGVAARRGPAARRLLWDSLAERRLSRYELLAPGVGRAFEELGRAEFDAATAGFDGHPAAPTLGVLHTRTARAIASSARWLLGPEADVRLPFVHPEVIEVSLRVSLDDKVGGGFYRRLLETADPHVAALPSTNDPGPRGRRGARRQTSTAALAAMAEAILAQDGARELLAPELRRALKDPAGRALVGRSLTGMRLLNWASLLADWQAAHAGRLAGTRFDPA